MNDVPTTDDSSAANGNDLPSSKSITGGGPEEPDRELFHNTMLGTLQEEFILLLQRCQIFVCR